MFSKNKWIICLLAIVLCSATACSPETQSNLKEKWQSVSETQQTPMPQMPELPPLVVEQKEIESNQEYIQSQIVEKDGKIMYFFDKTNEENKHPRVSEKVAGGFYRIVLGKTTAGHCAVQDFYVDTDQKQCEPLIVAQKDCDNFDDVGYDGTWIAYDEKQQLNGLAHFKDGKILNALTRNDDGVAYVDFAGEPKNTITVKFTDGDVLIAVYNNQEIEEWTRFSKNKQNQPTVDTVRYVNGQGDVATSHKWVNGKEKPINQKYIDMLTKATNESFLELGEILRKAKE